MADDQIAQMLELEEVPPPKARKSQKDDPAYEFQRQNMPKGKTPPHYQEDDFHPLDVTTEAPKDEKELTEWYGSLSPSHKAWANKLQQRLQSEGFSGWLDPKIKGKALELRNYLFDLTSQHWQHQRPDYKAQQKGFRKKRGAPETDSDDPKEFFKQKGDLKDVPNAVGALGGRMMEEDDAA